MSAFAIIEPSTLDHLWAAALAIALPWFTWKSTPALIEKLRRGGETARLSAYNESLWMLAAITLVSLANWFEGSRTLINLGLAHETGVRFIACACVTVAVLAFLVWQVRLVAGSAQHREQVRAQMGDINVALLMPRTRTESRRFACLALGAGVGEELAYRGFLLAYCAGYAGTWGGV
ncbi:MAG: hypothetical protein JNJ55_07250, partial [Betaproteobacteria bacterium]|nr:hypothetical protein [Betaproteobacteria bacterium]